MASRFNPPPGWPTLPHGWRPPEGWRPDPAWPAAPPDWVWWVEDHPHQQRPETGLLPQPARRGSALPAGKGSGFWVVLGGLVGVAALVVAYLQLLQGRGPEEPSEAERAAYIAKIEPLCQAFRAAPVPTPGDDKESQLKSLAVQASQIDGLRTSWMQIQPPEGDEESVASMTDQLDRMSTYIMNARDFYQVGLLGDMSEEMARYREAVTQFREKVRAYGLDGCVSE